MNVEINKTEYSELVECKEFKCEAVKVINDILADIENTDHPLSYEEVSNALHELLDVKEGGAEHD